MVYKTAAKSGWVPTTRGPMRSAGVQHEQRRIAQRPGGHGAPDCNLVCQTYSTRRHLRGVYTRAGRAGHENTQLEADTRGLHAVTVSIKGDQFALYFGQCMYFISTSHFAFCDIRAVSHACWAARTCIKHQLISADISWFRIEYPYALRLAGRQLCTRRARFSLCFV